MSAQAPPPLHPVIKGLAAVLVLCTLVMLWMTAARIKANKIAARQGDAGEPIAAPPPAPVLPELTLRPGRAAPVGHLTLEVADAALVVRDAQQRTLVRFTGLRTGQERGWQELRLRLLDVTPGELRVAPELRPGSPCYGAGVYVALRTGLRVDFPGGRSATLVRWPEARVKVEAAGRVEEQDLADDEPRDILGLKVFLRKQELDLSE